MWPREFLRRDMSDAEQDGLVAAFQQRAQQIIMEQQAARTKGKRKRIQGHAQAANSNAIGEPSHALPVEPQPSVCTPAAASFSSSSSSSSASTMSLPTTALPWMLSGCVSRLAEEPDALTVVDLPLGFSTPLRTSSRLAVVVDSACSGSDAATAAAASAAVPIEADAGDAADRRRRMPSKRYKATVGDEPAGSAAAALPSIEADEGDDDDDHKDTVKGKRAEAAAAAAAAGQMDASIQMEDEGEENEEGMGERQEPEEKNVSATQRPTRFPSKVPPSAARKVWQSH